MASDFENFKEFMRERPEVALAYVNGDSAPLDKIVAQEDPATFFGPMGGTLSGASEVSSRYRQDAGNFSKGGESTLEILHMAASEGLAYWVGIQRSKVQFQGKDPAKLDLRITEIFRLEGGKWRLIHRHADMLTEPPKK